MLFGQPLLFEFFFVDLLLASERLSEIIRHKLQGNQVLFHSLEHMLVSLLEELLLLMLGLNFL